MIYIQNIKRHFFKMNVDNKINQVLTKIEFDKKRFRVQQTQDIDPVRKASRDDRTDNWNGFRRRGIRPRIRIEFRLLQNIIGFLIFFLE